MQRVQRKEGHSNFDFWAPAVLPTLPTANISILMSLHLCFSSSVVVFSILEYFPVTWEFSLIINYLWSDDYRVQLIVTFSVYEWIFGSVGVTGWVALQITIQCGVLSGRLECPITLTSPEFPFRGLVCFTISLVDGWTLPLYPLSSSRQRTTKLDIIDLFWLA